MIDFDGIVEQFSGEYRWLSNFWPCELDDGPTIEHVYQSLKFTDPDIKSKIENSHSPGRAKKLAQEFSTKIDQTFHDRKVYVMLDLLREKFSEKNPELRQKLIDTDGLYIQEGNVWGDTFWGVDLRTGKGKNVLGNLIMRVRDEILEQ